MNRRTMANRTNSGSVFLPPFSSPRDEVESGSSPKLLRHLMEVHGDPRERLAPDSWPLTTALLTRRGLNNQPGATGRQGNWGTQGEARNFASGGKRS